MTFVYVIRDFTALAREQRSKRQEGEAEENKC